MGTTTVIISNNLVRGKEILAESSTTLRNFLEEHGMVFNPATFRLDSEVVTENMLDKTFEQLSTNNKVYISQTKPTDNN